MTFRLFRSLVAITAARLSVSSKVGLISSSWVKDGFSGIAHPRAILSPDLAIKPDGDGRVKRRGHGEQTPVLDVGFVHRMDRSKMQVVKALFHALCQTLSFRAAN